MLFNNLILKEYNYYMTWKNHINKRWEKWLIIEKRTYINKQETNRLSEYEYNIWEMRNRDSFDHLK